jgi:DNA-binding NarL/FixJ family response regulator
MTNGPTVRVIIADDHAVVRAGIVQFLEMSGGIEVVAQVDDGEQAIRAVEEFQPDVAILDIRMPEMTGIEATRWIRTHAPDTGVLVLTAYDDDPYVIAVLQAGANGYVLKTADAADIVRAVNAVHEGQSALDPAIARKVMSHVSGSPLTPDVEQLTERELEVLNLAARGHTNRAIGVLLGISHRTVQGHLAKTFGKLHANSRTEAVMRAVSLGWLPPDVGQLSEA